MPAGVDAGSIYSEVRVALDKLKADIAKVDATFDKFGATNKADADKVEKNWSNAFSGMKLAGTAAIAALTLAFKSSVSTFAKTEQSLANVRAVTGSTAQEFKQLEEAANEAGRTTRFRASEAADAMFYLASAGFDATQSIESLDGVLLLAGATGSDLAQSAQTVTATISQFGLEAADATKIVNVFAAANSNSQATLTKLQNGLKSVGPIAGQFNISLEETVASLQALYNAGLSGEEAGTALRNILLTLTDANSDVSKAFVKSGGSLEQINPRIVGLTAAFENLQAAGVDFADVFDKRAVASALILGDAATSTEKSLRDLEAAVTGTDEAAKQYAIQNDTLSGSFDKFKSALEGASNAIQKTLATAFRTILDAGASVLNFFTSLPAPLKGLTAGVGTAALAVGALSKALSFLGFSAGGILGPIGLVATAVAGIGIAYSEASREFREKTNQLKDSANTLSEGIKKLNTSSFDLALELEELQNQTSLTADQQKRQAEIVETLKKQMPNLTDEIINNTIALKLQAIEQEKVNQAQSKQDLKALKENLASYNKELENEMAELKRLDEEGGGVFEKLGTLKNIEKFKKNIADVENEIGIAEVALKNMTDEIERQEAAIYEEAKQFDEFQKAQAAAKQKREQEEADAKAAEEERIQREKDMIAAIEKRNLLEKQAQVARDQGLTKEKEKNDALIKANEELANSLIDLNYYGLTDEAGDVALRQTIERINELKKINKEAGETQEEIDDERKKALDEYNAAIELAKNRNAARLTSDKQANEEMIAANQELALSLLKLDFPINDEEIIKAKTEVDRLTEANNQLDAAERLRAHNEQVEDRLALERAENARVYKKAISDEELKIYLNNLDREIKADNNVATEREKISEAQEKIANKYREELRLNAVKAETFGYKQQQINEDLIKANENLIDSIIQAGYEDLGADVIQDAKDKIDALKVANEELDATELLRAHNEQVMADRKADEDRLALERAENSRVYKKNISNEELKIYLDKLNREIKAAEDAEKAEEALNEKRKADAIEAATDITDTINDIAQAFLKAGMTGSELVETLADFTAKTLQQSGDTTLAIIGTIIQIGKALVKFIDDIIHEEERLQQERKEAAFDTDAQILANRKASIDQAYNAEMERIRKLEETRLNAFLATLSDEEKAALKAAGVIEETNTERVDREIKEKLAAIAEETDAVKKAELEKQKATLENELEIAKIRDDTAAAEQAARDEREEKLRQYEHDKAVLDKDIALMNAQIDRETYKAKAPWYWSASKRESEAAKLYDPLIAAIQAIPIPTYDTGGIVLPQPGGVITRQAANGAPEMDLNLGASGVDYMNEFADRIAERINTATSGTTVLKVILDGQILAESTVNKINNNEVELIV